MQHSLLHALASRTANLGLSSNINALTIMTCQRQLCGMHDSRSQQDTDWVSLIVCQWLSISSASNLQIRAQHQAHRIS